MGEGKHTEEYEEQTAGKIADEGDFTTDMATVPEEESSMLSVEVRKRLYLFCFLMMPTLLVVQSVLAVVDVSRWVTVLVTALVSAVGYIGSYVGYQYAGKSK